VRYELKALVGALPDDRMQYIIRERLWKGRDLEAVGADLSMTGEGARQLLEGVIRNLSTMLDQETCGAPSNGPSHHRPSEVICAAGAGIVTSTPMIFGKHKALR
jgi:hypothetical protein